jgi:sigma-B regulation protein RsbU (phosphoserine phosphatase)
MASRRILLVEDSSTKRGMLSTMLRENGFDVQTANDGVQGLATARLKPHPELILTDYEMPELDGVGLCQAVKLDEELRSIPVLMLATLGGERNKFAGLMAGADDFIRKPDGRTDFRALCGWIRAHLRLAELRAELAEYSRQLEAAHKELSVLELLAHKGPLALMPHPRPGRGLRSEDSSGTG